MRKQLYAILVIIIGLLLCCSAAMATAADYYRCLEGIIDPENPVPFTIVTEVYGEMEPVHGYSPNSFVRILLSAELAPADLSETPDRVYVTLRIPEEQLSFDFFLAEADEKTYLRQRNPDGSEELFTMTMPDDVFILPDQIVFTEASALYDLHGLDRDLDENIPEEGWVYDSLQGLSWMDDNAVLSISMDPDHNSVIATIVWGEAGSIARYWAFTCEYDDQEQVLRAYQLQCYDARTEDGGEEFADLSLLYDGSSDAVFFLNDDGCVEIINTGRSQLEDKTFEPHLPEEPDWDEDDD